MLSGSGLRPAQNCAPVPLGITPELAQKLCDSQVLLKREASWFEESGHHAIHASTSQLAPILLSA